MTPLGHILPVTAIWTATLIGLRFAVDAIQWLRPLRLALWRLAQRGIGERAYWSAVSHLLRGDRKGWRLFKFAFSRRLQTAFLPPVPYLLHRPDTLRRLSAMASSLTGNFPVTQGRR